MLLTAVADEGEDEDEANRMKPATEMQSVNGVGVHVTDDSIHAYVDRLRCWPHPYCCVGWHLDGLVVMVGEVWRWVGVTVTLVTNEGVGEGVVRE